MAENLLRNAGLSALTLALLSGPGVTAPLESSRAKIEAALINIMTLDRPGRIRLATIWDGNKYVQCRRQPDQSLRCEAAGARMQPSLKHVLTRDKIGRMATLGWDLDPSFGNYVQNFASPVAANAIADKLQMSLGEGYDADMSNIEVETDWVKDMACPPRNGPRQNLAGSLMVSDTMAAKAVWLCSYAAQPDSPPQLSSAAALIDHDGPQVKAELQRLFINSTRKVFMILNTAVGYIQCQPDGAHGIYCEAVSTDSEPSLAGALTPDRVGRLHSMGFADPGRSPNYSKTYSSEKYDEGTITQELLTILYEVYGYDGSSKIDIKTEMPK